MRADEERSGQAEGWIWFIGNLFKEEKTLPEASAQQDETGY